MTRKGEYVDQENDENEIPHHYQGDELDWVQSG